MRLNEDTVIVGQRVLLIPYKKIHVEKYHSWMQSPEILKLTASERLNLEEEFNMQESWHKDEDKLTFIIVDKEAWRNYECCQKGGKLEMNGTEEQLSKLNSTSIRTISDADAKQRERNCMVGDVNLFFLISDSKELAEIEIMIAEPGARRKGFALEALKLMMAYGFSLLNVRNFEAKIGFENLPSIDLFTNKLGFSEKSRSNIFKEVTLRCSLESSNEELSVDDLIEKYFHLKNFSGLIGKYSEFRFNIT